MTIQFSTRSGITFTIQIKEDIGHAFDALVIKGGGKSFVGKTMLFPKNDMLNVQKI